MQERDFARLSRLVYDACGINLPPAKRTMLSTRLLKRLHALRFPTFGAYYDYVTSPEGRASELPHMIDVVSTNKTEFFREPTHFDHLRQVLLPALAAQRGARGQVRLWSAGCSSGEEPYTLAMVVDDWASCHTPLRYSVLASDISLRMLDRARRAVYPRTALRGMAPQLVTRYFMRGKREQAEQVRVVPELRQQVEFRRLNLMEPFVGLEPMDVIFCRNVIIYFDRETQTRLVERFERQLVPGGHLYLGHSETLNGINGSLVPVRPTIYRRPGP
jgi:chemotaxis protein methyltransferase CheR